MSDAKVSASVPSALWMINFGRPISVFSILVALGGLSAKNRAVTSLTQSPPNTFTAGSSTASTSAEMVLPMKLS